MKKVALVTGASSGIGEASVRRLLAAGFTVYAAARRVDKMQPLAAAGAKVLSLDVCDDASMVTAVEHILNESGRIDVLLNNAGYGAYGALEDVPMSEARRQVEVNLFGLARLIQLVLPAMRAQQSGRILNVSSIGGKIHEPFGTWYHATKFAVEGLSDCLRMELAPFGIDVVVIEPGAIKTEWAGIAAQSMLDASGNTAYRSGALAHAAMFAGAEQNSSDPKLIADVVLRAVQARRPRTRYAAGMGAKPILFLRWLLSDRAFDGFMRLTERLMAPKPSPVGSSVGV